MNIRATSQVLGVIGDPVAHSFSPDMHNAAIAALDVDYCYVAFHVLPDRVGEAMKGLRGLNIRGLNVTIPHKLAVMEHMDRISEEVLAVGAVNTISREGDELVGYNTDVYGVLTALRDNAGIETFPAHCVVLGAGGAARAVAYALGTQEGVQRVTILNRTVERAEDLAVDMEKITGTKMDVGTLDADAQCRAFADAGVVVNTTSLGMYPEVNASPLADVRAVHPDLVLYDTVFNPLETQLMRAFQAVGAPAFGGLDMLVFQGARSFAIWTGVEPPTDVMKDVVVKRVGTKMSGEHRHRDIARDVLLEPEAKRAFVRQMFDGIARRYDLLNHLLSLGIDIVWRKKTVDRLQPEPNWRILDLATGTGDLGFECGKRAGDIQVIGVDPSMPMLREGAKKNASRANSVAFLCGDGECLPFGEGIFDGVTIGFGIRNVAELETALSEMCRVLKVGGRVAVLEFSRPRIPVFRGLYNFYFQRILPRIGHMVSRDPNAYRYLYESVMRFPEGDDFCDRLSDAGFVDIQTVRLSFGIATIYLASKSQPCL